MIAEGDTHHHAAINACVLHTVLIPLGQCAAHFDGRGDASGHFDIQYASLSDGMSIVVGILDNRDVVIASDGCAGDPCDSDYVLKTARIGKHLCIGMTGDTDFMRELLAAIGLPIAEDVADEEIFWHLEEAGRTVESGFASVWSKLGCAFAGMRERLRESKYGVTTVIVGECDGLVLHSQWDEGNGWAQTEWNKIRKTAGFNLGRPANGEDELSSLYRIMDTPRGTDCSELRLVKAVRHWSGCDSGRTVNQNVFSRRLSEGFELSYSLDPQSEHDELILARLATAGATQI